MDATYTGEIISKRRKELNLTQKELAEKIHVTDKAVSKWERGLNFPDIALLDQLTSALEISVTELLGVEGQTTEEVIQEISHLSVDEKEDIFKNIRNQSWTLIVFGFLCFALSMYLQTTPVFASMRLKEQLVITNMTAFISIVIGSGCILLRHGMELRHEYQQSILQKFLCKYGKVLSWLLMATCILAFMTLIAFFDHTGDLTRANFFLRIFSQSFGFWGALGYALREK